MLHPARVHRIRFQSLERRLRVVLDNSETLVLEHRPIVTPAIAAALVFGVVVETARSAPSLDLAEWTASVLGISVGSFIAYLTALRSCVTFDSVRQQVRWNHLGWPGRGRGSCPLARITGIRARGDEAGNKRITLTTSEGVIPLTRHYSGFERHEQVAARVRAWLEQYRVAEDAG
jgi:hypothetical protein